MTSVIQLPYKEKKNALQLIEDVFKKNGVQFNLISEADSIPYLENRNYYYKFACYRKNFLRDKKNKYIDLDFQYLISLSRLDKELRYILLQMTLEIEHFLKVKILKDISYNAAVDGYAIVHDYISSYNAKNIGSSISIDSLIKRGSNESSANHGIYNKVIANQKYIAVWQLLEFMQMKELQYFFEFYFTRYPSGLNVQAYKSLIINTRYIRNAAAHNSPLLINLSSCPKDAFKAKNQVNKRYVNTLLQNHLDNARIAPVIKPTYRFKDIAGVLKLYELLNCSPSHSADSLVESLRNLFKKINDNPPCPKLNNDIMFFFKYLQNLFEDIYK